MIQHAFPRAIVALCAIALAACSGQSAPASSTDPEPENVVARVDGQPISAAALDAQVQAMSARGQPVQRPRALENLINLMVLSAEAERQGLPEQPDVAAEIERQRAALLAQHLVRAELSELDLSEDDLRQAYAERIEEMEGREYKASHILLDEQAQAQSVIEQLAEGADFKALAREHSTGPTGESGGSLGWFQADQMVGPFADAVRALEPGSYTAEPVQTRFGWHVVLLEDVREMQKPAFEDIQGEIRNDLVSEHVQSYIQSLRDQAEVEITAEDLESSAGGGDGTPEAAEQAAGGGDS